MLFVSQRPERTFEVVYHLRHAIARAVPLSVVLLPRLSVRAALDARADIPVPVAAGRGFVLWLLVGIRIGVDRADKRCWQPRTSAAETSASPSKAWAWGCASRDIRVAPQLVFYDSATAG
jgi:hypothetical protein